MRRYWLFMWEMHEACGGIQDLYDTYDAIQAAINEANLHVHKDKDCGHIFDSEPIVGDGIVWRK